MQTLVKVKLGHYPGEDKYQVRVVKVILNDSGDRVISKAILLTNGRWKKFDCLYPDGSTFEPPLREIERAE